MLFEDVIGQNEIKTRLIKSVNENRISHAQLFLGAYGTGNFALGLAFAQYIMCENKKNHDSCNECSSCVKNNKLIHPDLHFIFPTANTTSAKGKPSSEFFLPNWREFVIENEGYFNLDQWQNKLETENKSLLIPERDSADILKKLSLKSYESDYKVIIIWLPEKFNQESATHLLKTLEEPQPKTLFILVSQDSGQILPTILSRTQALKVQQIDQQSMTERLMHKYQVSGNDALGICKKSNGDFIDARNLIESSEAEKQFFTLFTDWMRMAFKADVISLINFSDEIQKLGREKQKQFLTYCLHLTRESLINNYGSEQLNKCGASEAQFLQKFAPYIHGANCIDLIDLFNKAHYHIERNGNPKIIFADVSFKLTKLLRVQAPVLE